MTDDDFLNRINAFSFVEEISIRSSYIDIIFKDDYLDYNERILIKIFKNNSIVLNEKLLQIIELDERKEFIKLVSVYLIRQEKTLFYEVTSKKEDFKHLARNREKKCFELKYYSEFCDDQFKLTKKDLEEYAKEEKFGPLSDFFIRISY